MIPQMVKFLVISIMQERQWVIVKYIIDTGAGCMVACFGLGLLATRQRNAFTNDSSTVQNSFLVFSIVYFSSIIYVY